MKPLVCLIMDDQLGVCVWQSRNTLSEWELGELKICVEEIFLHSVLLVRALNDRKSLPIPTIYTGPVLVVPGERVELPTEVPFTGLEGVDSDNNVVSAWATLEVHWSVPKLPCSGRLCGFSASHTCYYMVSKALLHADIGKDFGTVC